MLVRQAHLRLANELAIAQEPLKRLVHCRLHTGALVRREHLERRCSDGRCDAVKVEVFGDGREVVDCQRGVGRERDGVGECHRCGKEPVFHG